MTFWNRKRQLSNTLRSIAQYGNDVNIIIVDDCSTDGEDITCFETDKIKVVTLTDKTWVNPCIPFNIGFSLVNTDIVIIQNAECIHIGDIVGHALANCRNGQYLSYSAFSADKDVSARFDSTDDFRKVIEPYLHATREADWGGNGWYNHSVYRPKAYHFCAAITREDLYSLGGFDERFAKGSGFDDDEFITRIRRKGMIIHYIYPPFVVHQWHNPFYCGEIPAMMAINGNLFEKTIHSGIVDVKPYNRIYNEL